MFSILQLEKRRLVVMRVVLPSYTSQSKLGSEGRFANLRAVVLT